MTVLSDKAKGKSSKKRKGDENAFFDIFPGCRYNKSPQNTITQWRTIQDMKKRITSLLVALILLAGIGGCKA